MSIVGYDCDNRVLNAGDKCVVVHCRKYPERVGLTTEILAGHPYSIERVLVDLPPDPGYHFVSVPACNLRRISDDRPNGVRFNDFMRELNGEVRA